MRQFYSVNNFEKFALDNIIGQTFSKYSFGPQDMGQTLESVLFGGLIPKGQPDLVIIKDNEFLGVTKIDEYELKCYQYSNQKFHIMRKWENHNENILDTAVDKMKKVYLFECDRYDYSIKYNRIIKLLDLDVDKFKSDIVQRLGSRGYELYFKDLNTFMKCYKYREEVNEFVN